MSKWIARSLSLIAIVLLVNQPRFVCTNCGRVANKKKNLCSPKRIKDL